MLELLWSIPSYYIQHGGLVGAQLLSGAAPTLFTLRDGHCFYFLWGVIRRRSIISKESDSMDYYSTIKRNEIELFVVRWMDLESVTQSEVRKRKTNIIC